MGSGAGRSRGRGGLRADLVEAGGAVDRAVVPRLERHHGLAATAVADRRVVLAGAGGAARGPRALRGGAARGAALGVVGQPLAAEELLLARREDERVTAVPARQRTVLEHPSRPPMLPTLSRIGLA